MTKEQFDMIASVDVVEGKETLVITLDNVVIGASSDDKVQGITAIELSNFLTRYRGHKQIGALVLEINSGGGSLIQGFALADVIKSQGIPTHAKITGFCGSSATLLALACDESSITPSGMFMIHEPYAKLKGNCREMASNLATCEKLRQQMIDIYADKSGKSADEVESWMAAETYFVGQEAVDAGFVTAVRGDKDEDLYIAACALRDGTAEQKASWHEKILSVIGVSANAGKNQNINELQTKLYSMTQEKEKELADLRAQKEELDQKIASLEAKDKDQETRIAQLAAEKALEMFRASTSSEPPPPSDDVPPSTSGAVSAVNVTQSSWAAMTPYEQNALLAQGVNLID